MGLQKFATQASPEVLADVRAIADEEGRMFQAVVEEALSEWVARKRALTPRAEVIAHLVASLEQNDDLLHRLGQWPT